MQIPQKFTTLFNSEKEKYLPQLMVKSSSNRKIKTNGLCGRQKDGKQKGLKGEENWRTGGEREAGNQREDRRKERKKGMREEEP